MRIHAPTLAICLLCLALPLSADATAASLPARLDELRLEAARQGARVGVLVTTLDGTPVYGSDPDLPLIPASNMKLVTAATALRTWGTEYRFPTALYADAAPAEGTVRGNLYLRGCAHPVLDSGFFGRLARRLHGEGLRTVTGAVVAAGPVTAAGAADPLSDAAALLTELNRLGVVFGHRARTGDIPDAATRLLHWESESVGSLVRRMAKQSDNGIADGFMQALRVRHGLADRPYDELMHAAWDAGGLPVANCTFVDGSGLSRRNLLTPRFLVGLLACMRRDPLWSEAFQAALPIAGQDGTLRLRMRDTCAAGCVRAKTGFLTGVCTLSGYVDQGGRTLCFSLLMNEHRNGPTPIREVQNRACVAMTEWLRGGPAVAAGGGQ